MNETVKCGPFACEIWIVHLTLMPVGGVLHTCVTFEYIINVHIGFTICMLESIKKKLVAKYMFLLCTGL